MLLSEVKACNLCGSPSWDWEMLFPLNARQNLMRCNKCQLVFNSHQRTDFQDIYPDEYFDPNVHVKSGGGFFDYASLEKAIQKMYHSFYRFVIENTGEGNGTLRILDIGCSYGFFLKQFKNYGRFFTVGVELNKRAAGEAGKHLDKVYSVPFEEFYDREPFDFMSFFELIEHVQDPKGMMLKVNSLLKPGGYVLIATPDVGGLFFKLLGRRWPAIHADVHNYYFSSETIRRLAGDTGFEVISIRKSQILWYDVFHIRKRLSEMFPEGKFIFEKFSFMDSSVIPFLNGGDLRIILKKKA